MKILILIVFAFAFSSCQWILTHPSEDAEIIEISEDIIKDVYDYETEQLSPTPPVGLTQSN